MLNKMKPNFKSGFVALIGRPNVGKSSLMNTFVGQKVTIISDKPQTTRNQIRGILTGENYQIVWLDTPGIHKPLHKLGTKMNEKAKAALSSVDLVLWVLDAGRGYTAGDEKIAAELAACDVPVLLVWNKMDLLEKNAELPQVAGFDRVFRVSAQTGEGIDHLLETIIGILPEGPAYYPEDMVTDHPERYIVAELIREQLLIHTEDEVPHSVAVQVNEMKERDNGKIYIDAVIYVERASQKGIVIGAKGDRLKAIGRDARQAIEALLDAPEFLNLWEKVRKNWRNNLFFLNEFGYGDED